MRTEKKKWHQSGSGRTQRYRILVSMALVHLTAYFIINSFQFDFLVRMIWFVQTQTNKRVIISELMQRKLRTAMVLSTNLVYRNNLQYRYCNFVSTVCICVCFDQTKQAVQMFFQKHSQILSCFRDSQQAEQL